MLLLSSMESKRRGVIKGYRLDGHPAILSGLSK
jgi:hypothetical protein